MTLLARSSSEGLQEETPKLANLTDGESNPMEGKHTALLKTFFLAICPASWSPRTLGKSKTKAYHRLLARHQELGVMVGRVIQAA